MWGGRDIDSIIGLAWDCGAVTTGPVTVPIVLALGLGVNSSKESSGEENPLSGFGIVTLASLFPVLTVETLAIIVSFVENENVIKDGATLDHTLYWYSKSPAIEIIFACRAIIPLAIFLIIVLKFAAREPLPFIDIAKVVKENSTAPKGEEIQLLDKTSPEPEEPEIIEESTPEKEKESPAFSPAHQPPKYRPPPNSLWFALLCALLGMSIFNLGLTYGLSALGRQSGEILPGAFQEVDHLERSPRFPFGAGLTIVLIFSFVLGFLATIAEPALNVLGVTVEKLTNGALSKNLLIYSVSFGVGTGILLGVLKVVLGIPLIYFIFVGYTIAVSLTIFSPEDIVNVAWDSAGVTTGPVTVPFVLTVGVSLGNAVHVTEGFGILTMASVGPIISVLATGFIARFLNARKLKKKPSSPTSDAGAPSSFVELEGSEQEKVTIVAS